MEGRKFWSLLLPRLPRRGTPGICRRRKAAARQISSTRFPATLRWYGAATKAARAGNAAESCNRLQQILGTSILGLSRTTITHPPCNRSPVFHRAPADPPIFLLPMNRLQT